MKRPRVWMTPFRKEFIAGTGFITFVVVVWWWFSPMLEIYLRGPQP